MKCPGHGVEKQPGLTREWCVSCLDALVYGPAEVSLAGRNVDETDHMLLGAVELRAYMNRRQQERTCSSS